MEVNCLFQIGDKVFYPMHGAGMVKSIEEKEIQGEKQSYCVITIPISHMDIMIPLEKMEQLGVRSVVDKETMNHILFDFHHLEPNNSMPWKERYRVNLEKLKTGRMSDSAEVVRDLLCRNKEKSLNASEKQMLHQAQRNIISEISMINNITEHQAADLLKRSS
jgi:CarD family transcriptional regulator